MLRVGKFVVVTSLSVRLTREAIEPSTCTLLHDNIAMSSLLLQYATVAESESTFSLLFSAGGNYVREFVCVTFESTLAIDFNAVKRRLLLSYIAKLTPFFPFDTCVSCESHSRPAVCALQQPRKNISSTLVQVVNHQHARQIEHRNSYCTLEKNTRQHVTIKSVHHSFGSAS